MFQRKWPKAIKQVSGYCFGSGFTHLHMLKFFFFLKYNCCRQWRATWSSGPSPVPVAGVRSTVAVSATSQGSCPGLKLRWLRLLCLCWLDCRIRFDFTLWPSSLQRNCLSMGANLASVHSMEEYYQLQWLVMNVARSQRQTWIGGSDAQQVCYTLMQVFRCSHTLIMCLTAV